MAKRDQKTETKSAKSEVALAEKKDTKVVLKAKQNTQLPDGTFVGKGKEVEVTSSYAEKVLKEANTPFEQIIK